MIHKIRIEVIQLDNKFDLEFETEKEKSDNNGLVGIICSKIFNFNNNLRHNSSKGILKANILIDIIAIYDGESLLDTRKKEYDPFRANFHFGPKYSSQKTFAMKLVYAYNLIESTSKLYRPDIEVDSLLEDEKDENFQVINIEKKASNLNTFKEGSKKELSINTYERNQNARKQCLAYHGYHCKICGFNFYEKYGVLGLNYIQVHHIVPISQIGRSYHIDPIKDLIPVCANCHAMIHRKKETLSIDDMKRILNSL